MRIPDWTQAFNSGETCQRECTEALHIAIARARAGEGPSLVENLTYRWRGHSKSDRNLYRSKEEGGGQHFSYEPSLHAHAEERRKLEFSLRRALEKNEFVLNFQPVVDAKDESIVSFEALLRWHSEEHGFVSPAKFIPLAEDTRLIVPIGEWVLREACRQQVAWRAQGHRLQAAVNVSSRQLCRHR